MVCSRSDQWFDFRFGDPEPAECRVQTEREVGSVDLAPVAGGNDNGAICIRQFLQATTNDIRIDVEGELVSQLSALRVVLPLLDLLNGLPGVAEVPKELPLRELTAQRPHRQRKFPKRTGNKPEHGVHVSDVGHRGLPMPLAAHGTEVGECSQAVCMHEALAEGSEQFITHRGPDRREVRDLEAPTHRWLPP